MHIRHVNFNVCLAKGRESIVLVCTLSEHKLENVITHMKQSISLIRRAAKNVIVVHERPPQADCQPLSVGAQVKEAVLEFAMALKHDCSNKLLVNKRRSTFLASETQQGVSLITILLFILSKSYHKQLAYITYAIHDV